MAQTYDERLANLKKKSPSKTSNKEVVNILTELLAEPDGEKKFVAYLMDFHSSVAEQIFQKKYEPHWNEKLPSIVSAFMNNERFKKNAANASWMRVCVILKSFVQEQQDCTTIMKLFDRGMQIVSGVEGVSKNTMDVFDAKLLKEVGTEFFLYVSCPTGKSAVKTMDSFIIDLLTAGIIDEEDENIISWYHNHGRELRWKRPEIAPIEHDDVIDLPASVAEPLPTEGDHLPDVQIISPQDNLNTEQLALSGRQLQDTLVEAQQMANQLREVLSEDYGALAQMRQSIREKEQEITYLSLQLQERTKQLEALQQQHALQESTQITKATCARNEIQQLEHALAQMEECNRDLNERLALSLHMDGIAQNQELLTLKANIKKSLQLEYDDYLASQDAPFNEDEFVANRATISCIFRGLKRLGISFETEAL